MGPPQPCPEVLLVEIRPPGAALLGRWVATARRLLARHQATIGAHRAWDPRRAVVEHRVPRDAAEVVLLLLDAGEIRAARGRLWLRGEPGPPTYDRVDHEYRWPTWLHLTWSWPQLPTRLAVGELSPTTCTLRLTLRSRRRLRYPARYFDSAHTALAALEHDLDAAAP